MNSEVGMPDLVGVCRLARCRRFFPPHAKTSGQVKSGQASDITTPPAQHFVVASRVLLESKKAVPQAS
jgi:hypothetical protein